MTVYKKFADHENFHLDDNLKSEWPCLAVCIRIDQSDDCLSDS